MIDLKNLPKFDGNNAKNSYIAIYEFFYKEMNLIDEILDIADGVKPVSSIQYFNDIPNMYYNNVIRYSLNMSYSTIIYNYIDSLSFNRSNFIKVYKYIYERFYQGNTQDKHIDLKCWLNYTYAIFMASKSENKYLYCKDDIGSLIISYLNNIYDKFKENFIDNIIAIDCDTIFLKNNNNLMEIIEDTKMFECSIKYLPKVYFKGRKKYQVFDINNKIIKSSGIKI